MKRRYGAGAVIIGIFVAGVSVTSLTERYVSSAGAGTAAFSGAEAQDVAGQAEAAQARAWADANSADRTAAAAGTAKALEEVRAEEMAEAKAAEEITVNHETAAQKENAGKVEAAAQDAVDAEAAEEAKSAEKIEAAEDAEVEGEAEVAENAEVAEEMETAGDVETAEAETAQTALSMLRQSLEETEIETEALLAANASGQQGYDVWAAQLSEIEALLQDRLTAGEAEQLQEKQAAWRETLWAEEGNGSAGRSREETERLREETGRIRKRCYELLELYEDTLDGEGE